MAEKTPKDTVLSGEERCWGNDSPFLEQEELLLGQEPPVLPLAPWTDRRAGMRWFPPPPVGQAPQGAPRGGIGTSDAGQDSISLESVIKAAQVVPICSRIPVWGLISCRQVTASWSVPQ